MSRPNREVPWLEQRDNGWYYVHWYDKADRRTLREALGTRDPGEAQRLYAEFLLGGHARRARGNGLTVRQVLDDYVAHHVRATNDKGHAKVVAVERTEIAVRHLTAYFGDRPIKEIGPAECRGYLQARRDGKVGGWQKRNRASSASDSTVRRELAVLVSAANHARKWKTLPADEMPTVELPSLSDARRVESWTKEQLRDILKGLAQDDPLYQFIMVAYYTAGRRASVEDLRKDQVDFKAGTITLQPPDGRVTKKRRPTVPLFPEIRDILLTLWLDSPTVYLFGVNRDFYRRVTERAAEVGHPGHPHMLRHSRASHMLQDGESIFKVARLLGDTVQTVERVYAHALPEHMLTESRLHESHVVRAK